MNVPGFGLDGCFLVWTPRMFLGINSMDVPGNGLHRCSQVWTPQMF